MFAIMWIASLVLDDAMYFFTLTVAIAARMPTMATTAISSAMVKPRWAARRRVLDCE